MNKNHFKANRFFTILLEEKSQEVWRIRDGDQR